MLKTFAHHTPSEEGLKKVRALRESYSYLAYEINNACPNSRERSIALTELETSAMWAIKSIVLNDPLSTTEVPVE